MSEKEVREAAKAYLKDGGLCDVCWDDACTGGRLCDCGCHEATFKLEDNLKQALSEPPDVVVLLRWLEDVSPWHNHHAELARCIEHQFNIRLTDDGWEWVEEGE